MSVRDGPGEHTPLVRRASEPHQHEERSKKRTRTQIAVFCFTTVAYLYNFGTIAAQTALLERIVCHRHFSQVASDVQLDCTDDSVQRKLAILSQGEMTARLLPGTSISWGCTHEARTDLE